MFNTFSILQATSMHHTAFILFLIITPSKSIPRQILWKMYRWKGEIELRAKLTVNYRCLPTYGFAVFNCSWRSLVFVLTWNERETIRIKFVRFDVLTAVRMTMLFWVVTPYRHVGGYQRFGETYCLHLQGRHFYLQANTASQPRRTTSSIIKLVAMSAGFRKSTTA
jgi:hypothetical protein